MPILKDVNSYNPTVWENKKTKLNAANMNNIEAGVQEAKAAATDANAAATEAKTIANSKQEQLVSGTNIKTINNESILGAGDITISGGMEFDDLALYTKYGVFTVDGKTYNPEVAAEIELAVGATYEVSGYLKNGHIIVKATDPETAAANTQIIFNNVYIKSDKPQAIYSNQTKKKVVITALDNTENIILAGVGTCQAEDSEGVLQAEGNFGIVTGKDAKIYVKTTNTNQHAIKGSRLYLSGAGLVEVTSEHDGFHGGKLLRVDSGNYKVDKAAVDGFEAKFVQIFGGNIDVAVAYGDAISSKETAGVVNSYDVKFTFGEAITTAKKFNNISVLENVPTIEGITPVSFSTYFGTAIIKESANKPAGDFPTAEELANWTDIPLVNNKYASSQLYVYIKGYIASEVILTVAKSKLFADSACINTTSTAASLQYMATEKKLEGKANEDAILMVINTGSGDAIQSNSSVGLQENGNYIIKANTGYAVNNVNYLFTKGDGVKQFLSSGTAINAARFTIGADHDDIAEDAKADMFEIGSVFVNNTIKLAANDVTDYDGKLYFAYGQIGAVTVADYKVAGVVKFWKENLNVIQTAKSAIIIKTKEDSVSVDAYTKAESDAKYVLKTDYDKVVKKTQLIEDKFAHQLYPTLPVITYTITDESDIGTVKVVRGKDSEDEILPFETLTPEEGYRSKCKTVAYNKDGLGYDAGSDGKDLQFNTIVICKNYGTISTAPVINGAVSGYKSLNIGFVREISTPEPAEVYRVKFTQATQDFTVDFATVAAFMLWIDNASTYVLENETQTIDGEFEFIPTQRDYKITLVHNKGEKETSNIHVTSLIIGSTERVSQIQMEYSKNSTTYIIPYTLFSSASPGSSGSIFFI